MLWGHSAQVCFALQDRLPPSFGTSEGKQCLMFSASLTCTSLDLTEMNPKGLGCIGLQIAMHAFTAQRSRTCLNATLTTVMAIPYLSPTSIIWAAFTSHIYCLNLAEIASANAMPASPAHNVVIVAITHDGFWKFPHSKTVNSVTCFQCAFNTPQPSSACIV